MSIILKGNNISSNNNGIGPSEVTNIKASQNASSIILSWTNPSNVVINGTTLSTFDHVIVVKNASQVPSSVKDGTVIYNGKSTTCADSNVTKNTKYYYRFFVYDTNKLCNNNINMIIESTFYGIDMVLKNNTWSQIAEASESGIASSLWKIGDEIDIELSEQPYISAETVTLQIWDFNHFDKSDGSGKAGIVFGAKNLTTRYMSMTSSSHNYYGWNNSFMKNYVMTNMLNAVPEELRNVIKEVNTYANRGSYSNSESEGTLSTDKIFLPGASELIGDDKVSSTWSIHKTESNQKQFPIFTDDNSRMKKVPNKTYYESRDYEYWTRSAFCNDNVSYCYIVQSGACGFQDGHNNVHGLCFCFNV